MDRHDVSETVTAENVAQLHKEDLKIEHLFGCRGITYWFDDKRKTAFCLVEAPNKEAVLNMHNHAHGEVPHKIIEVNEAIVESFLGRIEDPIKAQNTDLNIINDPAFRVIMVIETSSYLNRLEANQFSLFAQKFHNSVTKSIKKFNGSIVKRDNNNYLIRLEANQFSLFAQKFHNSVTKSIKKFNGSIVKRDNNNYLISFKSVSNAVFCSLKIQTNFKYITPKFDLTNRKMNIALCAGVPVSNKEGFFEESIELATRICEVVKEDLVITNEIKALYESENRNAIIDKDLVRILKPSEEKFLTQIMDYVEGIWNKPNFNVTDFSKGLGYSKSQFYRKLKNLTGKSPNNFIKEFRLHKALDLLHKQHGNISEIAYESGFNSPAYFSKCFMDKFRVLPSKYIQQHII